MEISSTQSCFDKAANGLQIFAGQHCRCISKTSPPPRIWAALLPFGEAPGRRTQPGAGPMREAEGRPVLQRSGVARGLCGPPWPARGVAGSASPPRGGHGGLAEGAGAGRAAPARCQRKIGLLCNRELALRNLFRELSSPDLLLQQEQSHTKAFSRAAKIAPPSPCRASPRALGLPPAPLRRRGPGGTASVPAPPSWLSPRRPQDQGGSGHPAEERAAVALLAGGRGTVLAGSGDSRVRPPRRQQLFPLGSVPRACCQKCLVALYCVCEEEEHVLLPFYRWEE